MLFEQKLGMPRASIFDSLFAREKLGSTGLGQGIAIPHGRIKGLKQAAGAVIRLQTPIPFDSPDGKPVTLLFVLLVPEQATEEHLQILFRAGTTVFKIAASARSCKTLPMQRVYSPCLTLQNTERAHAFTRPTGLRITARRCY